MKYPFNKKVTALLGAAILFASAARGASSIVGTLGTPTVVSTVPANGDVNPYGVAFVPSNFPQGGLLKPGDILVSNFNNSDNMQGTGTTIMKITGSTPSVFFQGKAPLGLSTGLAVLQAGLVLVANFPTMDGTSATAQAGSLIALDSKANVVWTYTNALIDGPWDFTVNDQGSFVQVFVSNVLNGTIVRLDLSVAGTSITVQKILTISSGYGFRGDPAALEVGPTGLAYDATRDILYVAGSFENAIYAIPNAGGIQANGGLGYRIYQDSQHLHGALAMILAPNGHLIVSNSDVINSDEMQPSELVEFTVDGQFVAQYSVDPSQGGAFGLAAAVINGQTVLAAVDDATNSLDIWPAVTTTPPPTGSSVTIMITGPNGAIPAAGTFQTVSSSVSLSAAQSTSTNPGSLTYSWTLSPGYPAATIIGGNTATPTIQFPTHGTYQITLTVTDATGATSSTTVTLQFV